MTQSDYLLDLIKADFSREMIWIFITIRKNIYTNVDMFLNMSNKIIQDALIINLSILQNM